MSELQERKILRKSLYHTQIMDVPGIVPETLLYLVHTVPPGQKLSKFQPIAPFYSFCRVEQWTIQLPHEVADSKFCMKNKIKWLMWIPRRTFTP